MITILAINLMERDLNALRGIVRNAGWELHEGCTFRQAMATLLNRQVHVVISERELPVGDSTHLLQILGALACPPRLIVTSGCSDDYLSAEEVILGAFDVLPTPFESSKVTGIVKLAYFAWLRERKWTQHPVAAGPVTHPPDPAHRDCASGSSSDRLGVHR
jgi:DNA-binding NtrC family response regulator